MHKRFYSFVLISLLATGVAAWAAGPQDGKSAGILPGEPDPNAGPGGEHSTVLVDDRKPCREGTKRFQKMKCAKPDAPEPDCMNVAPVLECLKSPPKLKCKAPEIPVGEIRCIPDGKPAQKN